MQKLHPKIREYLATKGIEGADLDDYLSDKPQKTYDPFLLPDIEAGADRILSVIEEGGKICIYGDYDADGVTATSLLVDVLGELTDNLTWFIPSRFKEGYGLNKNALRELKESGVDLVVTVDNGCTAFEEIKYAGEIGLEIVVTDHHEMETKPNCLCINPKSPESEYPFRGLAGVGVAFKLAQVICDITGLPGSVKTRNLDLVAVGTIADLVPLVDENRTLVKYGLRLLNLRRRPGFAELMKSAGLGKEIKSENVAFGIAPRINASGRMASAKTAAKLMMEENQEEAANIASELEGLNYNRKKKQSGIVEICDKVLENAPEKNIIILTLNEAHEGVTGIAAGKLKEEHGKPVVIMSRVSDDLYKGTSRSTENIDLHKLLSKAAEENLFESFGGHSAACGFTIKKENRERFIEITENTLNRMAEESPEILQNRIKTDIRLEPGDITADFIRSQECIEPCGKDNERPIVEVVLLPGNIKRMGRDNQYLRFEGNCMGKNISAVVFDRVDQVEKIVEKAAVVGAPVKVAGYINENHFNGRVSIQISVMEVVGI